MKINYRQLSIMVFLSFISLKFLALPSVMYITSGNMSWLVALVLMIIDGLYAFMLVGLMKKCKDKNINEFLINTVGVVLAKIIFILLSAQFIIQIINLTKGLEFFVVENFYDDFNWLIYVLPLIILTGFMMYKGIRNIARVEEMFCWAITIGCIYIALKCITCTDPRAFLPMFKDGVAPLFHSAFKHYSWFGSATFLIMLFGKVDFTNAKKSVLIKYVVFAILLVQFLYFVFYGLFDTTSPTHNFCLSDVSQFSSNESIIDELSWLVVSLWVIAQALQLAVYGYCLVLSVMFAFNIKAKIPVIIAIDLLMFSLGYIGEKTVNFEQFFFNPAVSALFIFNEFVIPFILLIGYGVKRKKDRRKAKVVEDESIKIVV